jgi:hypothetical protein
MHDLSSMSAMNEFQCPLTRKIFPFVLRDSGSRKEALARQKVHTQAEVQRLERLAGKELSLRELLRLADQERAKAAVEAAEAAEAAAAKPQEKSAGDIFGEALMRTTFPNAC